MSVPDFDFQFDPRRIPEISQKYKYDPRGVVASVISPSVMVKRSRSRAWLMYWKPEFTWPTTNSSGTNNTGYAFNGTYFSSGYYGQATASYSDIWNNSSGVRSANSMPA